MNEFLTNTSELKTLKRVWLPSERFLHLFLEKGHLVFGLQNLLSMILHIFSTANISSCEAECNFWKTAERDLVQILVRWGTTLDTNILGHKGS